MGSNFDVTKNDNKITTMNCNVDILTNDKIITMNYNFDTTMNDNK
jgi:hypothetical protein